MLRQRFEHLDNSRSGLKAIAEECSKLTIRYIFPPEGTDFNTELGTPYQSVGSRGVNNLASKLLTTILPPDGGFFRLTIPEYIKAQLQPDTITQLEDQIALAERVILQELADLPIRQPLFEALKHLLITGNVAVWLKEDKMAVYSLRDFVVVRDKTNRLVEVILRESIDLDALPDDLRDFVEENRLSKIDQENPMADQENPSVDIYTGFKLENNKWHKWQEIDDLEVPDSEETFKELPVYVLRYTDTQYGRGLVEQHLGDLRTLEALSKALTEGSLISAKAIFLVNPVGTTNAKKLAKAANGDIIEGNPNDVGTLQVQKQADFSVALSRISDLENRLNQVFLIFQPRQAERVTAEEIRRLTEELESLLGGVYSLLSEELQKPLVKTVYEKLKKEGKIPPFPDDIKLVITTGFEALSKTAALNKLFTLLQAIAPIQEAWQYVNWSEYLSRILQSLNIDPKGLTKSDEQLMAETEELMRQQVMLQQSQKPQETQGTLR